MGKAFAAGARKGAVAPARRCVGSGVAGDAVGGVAVRVRRCGYGLGVSSLSSRNGEGHYEQG